MNAEKFTQVYREIRNGCNGFFYHPLVRKFQYSDGVRDLANTGCAWLLDILATELPAQFTRHHAVSNDCYVAVTSAGGQARIEAEFEDDVVGWSRDIDYTDLPEGVWKFHIVDEGHRYAMILLTEH